MKNLVFPMQQSRVLTSYAKFSSTISRNTCTLAPKQSGLCRAVNFYSFSITSSEKVAAITGRNVLV